MGFICVRMSSMFWLRNLLPLYRVTSKKVSSVSLMSCVNLMVSCSLFISVIYSKNCSWDPVQMIKNVIYEPFPDMDMLFTDVYKLFFQFSHEKVCISWCHFSAHGSTLDL